MMRYAVVATLIFALASCGSRPIEGASQLPFSDSFNRPDTAAGDLGSGWHMHGAYVDGFPLPPAVDGFIRNGKYTYSGNTVVYAARQFRATVRQLGTIGRWRKEHDGAETTLAMALTSNDRLVADMVHFVANRGVWELTVRRSGGAFEPVVKGAFKPTLALDQDYRFEIEVTDDAVAVRVPGDEVVANVSTVDLVGKWAFWEQYPAASPARVVFDFDEVWAQ